MMIESPLCWLTRHNRVDAFMSDSKSYVLYLIVYLQKIVTYNR